MEIHIGNRVAEIELVSKEDNKVVLTIDGKTFEADVVMAENGNCNILMDGRSSNAQLIRKENGKSYKVNTHYSSFNVEIIDSQAKYLRMRKKGEEEQNDRITSPMPGKVVKIPVSVGQEMKAGETVIVIEAMKMQSNYKVTSDHQLLKSKEQGYYIETPKTKNGTRQVPLSRETIQAFQRVMKKRPKAEPFVIDGRSNFLFVNHKGKPKVAIDYNALFVRMVKKYNKQHKDNPLPHITPHTLRHTFCTRLASKNMNPKDLQYIMGHSNISITMNWYAHASIDTAKSEVQRLIA